MKDNELDKGLPKDESKDNKPEDKKPEEKPDLKEDVKETIKETFKEQVKRKIWLFIAPMIPYFIVIFFGVVFLATLILPLTGFFGNPIGSADEPLTKAEQTFVDKLKESEEYWLDKDVVIDRELILATIFFEEPFSDDDLDCLEESTECTNSSRNYTELAKEIPTLADNMVDSKTIYYCSNKLEEVKNVCEIDEFGRPTRNCHTETTITYEEPLACGSKIEQCASVCKVGYETSSEILYFLKDQAVYLEWLKTDFLEDKLKSLDYDIPADETAKQALLNDTIDKILSMKATVSSDDGYGSVFGAPMNGFGAAGPIPETILKNLLSPLGTQRCVQTACYGNYGVNNCQSHSGVDLGNNGTKPMIYSVFAGKVISIAVGSGNCVPDFNATPKCQAGCSAKIVLIEHEIFVDGVAQKIFSKYVHLDSIVSGIVVGAPVYAGQAIGVMGNTGCSTATHLHFELWDASRQRYNPEELLSSTGCSTRNDCNAARLTCGS